MSKPLLPETNKRPGVHYAVTQEGIELPVVDVTHPGFRLAITETERRALAENFLREGVPFAFLPKPVRNFVLDMFLRGSTLANGVRQARGTFMSGMHTYLLKLGPEMLGTAYAKPLDRRIASSLPAIGVRLRTQDMAHLMADSLEPALTAGPRRPLIFLNIAGGPAIDSLNSLLVLKRNHPGILAERDVSIVVLDLDDAGPAFGRAALGALSEPQGPLCGLRIAFRHVPYDWNRTEELKAVLEDTHARGELVIGSSEGGLFEYGSDAQIETNLNMLRRYPEVQAFVGSVTRADAAAKRLHETGSAALRPRGLAVFRDLVQRSGWNIARVVEGPFSDQVVLT